MNTLGLVFSYVLVFFIIGVSTLLQKKKILDEEGARKFIHIGVSNWWILAMIFFTGADSLWFAMVPPITFIGLNYLSYRQNIFKAMERGGSGNLGTVYFPISLLILVIVSFGILNEPYLGGLGILILGYGDGFAAVIGKKYGKHKFVFGKSLEGSITMFVVSLTVSFIVLSVQGFPSVLLVSLLVALIATVIELITPKGLDNLSVPLLTTFLFYLIFLI